MRTEAQVLIAGRYRLHTALGRGAMGEVWRARDEVLGADVAVKVLLAQSSDPTAAARFRLEAQTAGSLNHPNVVGVYDFGAHEDRLFLVMELVEGDSLARLLNGVGRLSAEQVARIAAQAASGLAAAHQRGIVHRDVKPGNLLLDAHGTVKIGDFGIARFLDDPGGGLTATGQVVGTSLYLAPERALGQPAGPASDVYALGCVLYQLLTGRPPFRADTAIGVLHQHLDSAPTPPRDLGVDLPPALENYLLAMLAKQPEERPAAQEAADWFGAGAWRGHAEPLPAAEPRRRPPVETQRRPPAEPGPATTYALPTPDTHGPAHATTAHRARRAHRPAPQALVLRRPKVLGAVAAAALFVAALLIGMTWLAPSSGPAKTSGPDASPTTTADPAARTSTSPSPSPRPTDAVTPTAAIPEERPAERPEATAEPPEARKGKPGKGHGG